MKNIIIFLVLLFSIPLGNNWGNVIYSQNLDSLWSVYNSKNQTDTNRLKAIEDIVEIYVDNNPDTAIIFAQKELRLAQETKQKKYEGWALYNLGSICVNNKDYSKALEYFFKSLKIKQEINKKGIEGYYFVIAQVYSKQSNQAKFTEYFSKSLEISISIGDKQNIADLYNSIGAIYHVRFYNYPKALDYTFKALKIYQGINNKHGIADSYFNIGQIYWQQPNYKTGLEYHLKALKYYEEINDKKGIAKCYNIMAAAEVILKSNFVKAMEYYLICLKIWEEIGNKEGISTCLNNMGEFYRRQENYTKALDYYLRALSIKKELGDEEAIAFCYINLGELYNNLTFYKLAIQYSDSALDISRRAKNINEERFAYENLATAYSKISKYKEAYDYRIKYQHITDSLFNGENSKKINDLQSSFETEKRESEQAKLDAIALEQKKQQQFIIYAVGAVLLIVIIFSGLLYKRFRLTAKQKQIIEIKSKEVEEKQHEIIDSITYAKRLQQAILPSIEAVKEQLPNSFVYYQPKDIVAGDFYWMHTNKEAVYIAAADCTGHGVPGAMVSVVCSNALNRAVNEFNLTDTGLILDKTRELVIETFEKSDSEVKDGMDISLLRIELPLNDTQNKIQWSGANNSLWYILNNELVEVKADKQPIGKYSEPNPFITNTFSFNSPVSFYLFSDGYADQFGINEKKLMKKKFKDVVLSMQNLSMHGQKNQIEKVHVDWKGNMEQTDDVLVIGIKI